MRSYLFFEGRCEEALGFYTKALGDARRLFGALCDGGTVRMPLGETFFSPCFGMVADRFGVVWMVIVAPEEPAS